MPRYVAFLRGINLGGRRIKNEDLRARFEAAGARRGRDLQGQRQRGLRSGRRRLRVADRLESRRGWASRLATRCPVFLRAPKSCGRSRRHSPFDPGHVEASAGKLQVSMLHAAPSTNARREVLAMATDEDRLDLRGRELYWLPSGGMLDSVARPRRDRRSARPLDPAHQGHDRPNRREVLRRLTGYRRLRRRFEFGVSSPFVDRGRGPEQRKRIAGGAPRARIAAPLYRARRCRRMQPGPREAEQERRIRSIPR